MKDKIITYCAVLTLFISEGAFAAGKGSGTITDLIFPAINFLIFFGIIYWKVKPAMKSHYAKLSEDISAYIERAKYKSFEASTKLDQQKKRMESLQSDIEQNKKKILDSISNYKTDRENELQNTLDKTEKDSIAKIEAEKSAIFKEINNELTEQVISLARQKISSDSHLKKNIGEQLLKGLKI
jgi:F-type H+-transporting ATPase subunit b